MAKLNRSRQEAFAYLVASGMAPDLAVTAAGYRTENTRERADVLLGREEVAQQVAAYRLELGKAAGKPEAAGGACGQGLAASAAEDAVPAAREIDREWVIDRLVENVERSLGLKPVRDRLGGETGASGRRASAGHQGAGHQGTTGYQGSVANKALELLGRQLGLFRDKDEEKGGDLHDLSDAELERLDQDLGRQIAALEGIRRRAEAGAPAPAEPERTD